MDSIGSLWLKDGKNGKFMSGKIKQMNGAELSILVFKNDKGGVEKRPDYRIYLAEQKDEAPRQPAASPASNPRPEPKPPVQNDFTDDIPF